MKNDRSKTSWELCLIGKTSLRWQILEIVVRWMVSLVIWDYSNLNIVRTYVCMSGFNYMLPLIGTCDKMRCGNNWSTISWNLKKCLGHFVLSYVSHYLSQTHSTYVAVNVLFQLWCILMGWFHMLGSIQYFVVWHECFSNTNSNCWGITPTVKV